MDVIYIVRDGLGKMVVPYRDRDLAERHADAIGGHVTEEDVYEDVPDFVKQFEEHPED
jgi:hypothetical protein